MAGGLAEELRRVGFSDPQHRRRVPVSRASFTLTDRSAFDDAVQLAVAWAAKTAAAEFPTDAAEGQGFAYAAPDDRASVSALRVDNEEGRVWAARVGYRGDRIAGREWTTDLFVEQRLGAFVRFGAQLTCQCLNTDPGFDHSRPRIVRDILDQLAGESDEEALGNTFHPVDLADVQGFISLLYNPARRLPVILVSVDDSGGSQVDLAQLANRLSGTAHLRSISVEESFELSRLVGRRMSTFNGAVRAYMPGLDQETEDPFQHPLWFAPSSGRNPRLINHLAARILPLGFRDPEGDARFWRVSLIRQATSRAAANTSTGTEEEKLLAEIEALRSELEEARESASSAESLMYEEATKLADAQTESAKLEEENYALRERLKAIGGGSTKDSLQLEHNDIRSVFDQDPPLETSLRLIATVFSDRVIILDNAIESARDSYAFKYRKKAFTLLWSLCTDYWTSLADGKGDGQARQCFGSSFAAKEAETISTAGLARRTFTYNGLDMPMEKHLKIGVADNKAETLRVHFEWIPEERLIVVGHCGGHLDF